MKALMDAVYEASKGIRTIAPHEKPLDPDGNLSAAQVAISSASHLYILGFGFDINNCELLKLDESLNLAQL